MIERLIVNKNDALTIAQFEQALGLRVIDDKGAEG